MAGQWRLRPRRGSLEAKLYGGVQLAVHPPFPLANIRESLPAPPRGVPKPSQ